MTGGERATKNVDARAITAWVCDECGYWRKEEATGVHATSSPSNPNGALVRHPLRKAEFVEVQP